MALSLESTIRECADGLKSARANERKKSAETLKEFLSRNAAPALLSENTLKGSPFTWTSVFNDISEFIFKESEKYEVSKTYDSVIAPLCSSLLHLCIAGSNKGKAYVKCDVVVDTSLSILKDSRLARAIGDAYLSVLYKHVLQHDHYLNLITPSSWEDLLDICMDVCLKNISKLDDFTKLRLVYLVMRNGTKCCQIIIPLRDSLSKLKKCFARLMCDKKVQEVIIDIVTLLLEMLSSECRLSLCEFTESMMTTFLKFYDQNFDKKKKMAKDKGKNKRKYSLHDLVEVVENVRQKKMNSYEASQKYGIPRSTIVHRLYGTRGAKQQSPGRPPELSLEWESKVASYLHVMEKCGYPLTSKEVKSLISNYIKRNGIITRFKDDYPGKEWFRGFKRRQKLSLKKPQSVEMARKKACNPFTVYNYFDLLERAMQELGLTEKPHRIYNLDETSFCSDPSKTKVVGLMGFPSTRTTGSPGRNNTSVLLATNALGEKNPPLIIFQGKQLWNEWFYKNKNVNTAYAVSRKGWMETKIFEQYLKNVLLPAIGAERPVLLIYDGHSTHVDLSIIELLEAEQVTVLKLPAHSSHILQPLDCSTMKPMKDKWDSELVKWQRLHVQAKLPKQEFARIITMIWDDLNPVIIQNGFRKTGIYPLKRDAIQREKFDNLSWSRWEEHIRHQNVLNVSNYDDKENLYRSFTQEDNIKKNNKTPTLMSMCLNTINRGMTIYLQFNSKNSEISEISKEIDISKRTQTFSQKWATVKDPKTFILSQPKNTNAKSNNYSQNLQIIDNVLLNSTENKKKVEELVGFEELLLKTISRNDVPKTSRKRVSQEAEILTYKDVIHRMRKEKEDKDKAEEAKRLNKLKRAGIISIKNKKDKKKDLKRKTKATKNKRKKILESDSESDCSYTSIKSSEDEDLDTYLQSVLEESIDEDLQEQIPSTKKISKHKEKENLLEKKTMIERSLVEPLPSTSRGLNRKSSLFKLLSLTIALHHPDGKLQHEEGSLAHDWTSWNKSLYSILEVVSMESSFLQKVRKSNDNLKYCSDFYTVSAAAYFLIFNVSRHTEDNESSYENASKRQRTQLSKNKCFSDIVNELRQNYVPWLGTIDIYLQKYLTSITTTESLSLLSVIEQIISNNNSNVDWDALQNVACLTLRRLQSVKCDMNDYDVILLSLWNLCVRNSTSSSGIFKATHSILQFILRLDSLQYLQVQPLFKLYFENGMPVSDCSVTTLKILFHKFFNKCSIEDKRLECFTWLIQGNITSVKIFDLRDFLVQILSNENVKINIDMDPQSNLNLKDIFESIDKCILFSEFEVEYCPTEHTAHQCKETDEINSNINKQVCNYFIEKILEYSEKNKNSNISITEYINLVNIALLHIDINLKYEGLKHEYIKETDIYRTINGALNEIFVNLVSRLRSNIQVTEKNAMLRSVQAVLISNYDAVINALVRENISTEFFHCLNSIMCTDTDETEDVVEVDLETYADTLKYSCMSVLSSYCRRAGSYRTEVLDLILDAKTYDFSVYLDVECAFRCIDLLCDRKLDNRPIELICTLLQNMCRSLFRDSAATYKILNILISLLDQIWDHESSVIKKNCYIMVRSYMQRCEQSYYSPKVAALVYECAAKLTTLNSKNKNSEFDTEIFTNSIMEKIKGPIHNIRLTCSYLVKATVTERSETDIDGYLNDLTDIFIINVSERQHLILKDESANRTLTLLHAMYALVQSKNSLLHKTILTTLHLQKEKSLDKDLVQKVLNLMTTKVTSNKLSFYLNENILSIISFWFTKKNTIDELPVEFFEMNKMDLIVNHMGWLLPAEILLLNNGNVENSNVLNDLIMETGKSQESLLESCFCCLIALCLPYIVTMEYALPYTGQETKNDFKKSTEHANCLFRSTRQIIGVQKWSQVFADNIGDLVLLTANNFRDPIETEERFKVKMFQNTETYCYPKYIFTAILKYFGKLIDGNIMQYLCESQPHTMFKVLFRLWQNVVNERVTETRILALNTFVTLVEECVPLDFPSDAFVCNFVCNSLAHAIKMSKTKIEQKALAHALWICLQKFLPAKVDLLRKSVALIMSILLVKKEEGYADEFSIVWEYLSEDMKEYLKEGEDVIDFIQSLSQGVGMHMQTSCKAVFLEKLKTYESSLSCPSHEALGNLQNFLKLNRDYLYQSAEEPDKSVVETCGVGVVHQVISSLCNILNSASDDKTIIETCNCLAEIGFYDLKTLVTIPPVDTQIVADIKPNEYFAYIVVKALSRIIFDEDPLVTDNVTNTLTSLFQYREGSNVLGFSEIDCEMLKPFSTSTSKTLAEFKINIQKFEMYNNTTEFWIPKETGTQAEWVTRVTVAILEILISDNNYIDVLKTVCVLKPSVCESILPPLVGLLLAYSSEPQIKILSDQLNNCFLHVWDKSFDSNSENSEEVNVSRKDATLNHEQKIIVQTLLDVVNFVRLQRSHYKFRPDRGAESLNYLRLEYDKVAWAATKADQSLVALYYGELWAIGKNDGVPPSSPEATSSINGGENVQRIFRKCYVSIGEMDAIEGCGTAHLTSEEEKRKHLINTGQYSDALLMHDIALSCGSQVNDDLQYGVVKSLHKSGMHHLALQYIKSLPENDKLSDMKYDCLSFLGDWTEFVDTIELEKKSQQKYVNPYSVIKAHHYACLKDCLNMQTTPDSDTRMILPLSRAKLAISKLCQDLNMVNCQNVYKVVGKLHLFRDIEDYFAVRCDITTIDELLDQWKVSKLPPYHDFKHMGALISQRCLILEHAAKSYENSVKDIISLQLEYTKLCVVNHNIQMAQRFLAVVKKMETSNEISLVEGELSWAKGHRGIALSLIRDIVSKSNVDGSLITAKSLRQYGIWMAETKSDNARDIIDKYLKKSLKVLNREDHAEIKLKVYYDIARFADAEYKQVVSYMSSSIFENKVKCLETLKGTASSLRSQSQQTLNRDERRALVTNEKFRDLDENEIANTKAEKESFLHLALRYYLLSLKQCEDNNLSVFRVISLWFDNPSIELHDSDADTFEDLLHAIPSRKFITVLPQLAPRLTTENTPFTENLRKIIKRCATEHPHHTLPILFSLKNSDKDKQILNMPSSGRGTNKVVEPRISAAEQIVKQLAKQSKEMKVIVEQMEKMCDAMISFANYVPKSKDSKQRIPAAELINKLTALDAIPIATVTVPLREDCTYSYLITLLSFENYFELVGGINCPKKIICKSSDGRKRVLLVKGEDDLRQDAVMQQVFNIVNTLLEKDPITSRNKLLVRTYKVVPMSRRSGVLEWCEGTLPLGSYLVGNQGAHMRYRPQDITPNAARMKLQQCHEQRKSNKEKYAVFIRVLREFKPVFHYFFTEHYLDPVTWYERRLAYTKSVSTSSMVGYILGLGDRHVQNILIDQKTAEVIHIDFGIAFDQGKALPTPETVPFRLTQDMIAGFGASGVEGLFRKYCEKTMQLLRDNSETLLTILEVLLCDPLYSWTVTTQQNKDTSMQCMTGPIGSLAERALLTVSGKLSGTEGGTAGGVAVPGQVARLLAAAVDPANLCRLFPGWQPYL